MDSVSYAFCSSVVAALNLPSSTKNQFSSVVWLTATEHEDKHRMSCELYIRRHIYGSWSYRIDCGNAQLNFLDLKQLNRRHLRFTQVRIVGNGLINFVESSFEEIKAIVNYTIPSVNMAELRVCDTKDIPTNQLQELLLFFRNTFFREISSSNNSAPILDFLLPLFRSDFVRYLEMTESICSSAMKARVREFALQNRHESFNFLVVGAKFDLQFFEQLFEKPVTQTERFCFYYSFDLYALKNFKKHLLLKTFNGIFRWKRSDGVKVSATQYGKRLTVCLERL